MLLYCVDFMFLVYICADFMLKSKGLLEYTNLFSPNDYERNGKLICKYFQ